MITGDFYGPRGQAIAEVCRAYEEIMGRVLTRPVLEDIGYYIDRGAKSDLIIKAIDITASKGADWRYTTAILKRCIEEGIYDKDTYDFKVRYKRAAMQCKKDLPYHMRETLFEVIYLAVALKEDVLKWEQDMERYVQAVRNGEDTSRWDERWGEFGNIESGTI